MSSSTVSLSRFAVSACRHSGRSVGLRSIFSLAINDRLLVSGALVSYINHRWLERVISALGKRIAVGQRRERGGGIVIRAVLRYAFIAVGAYVIFNVSLMASTAFWRGVCLPIVAIICEAAVEIFVGLRREL